MTTKNRMLKKSGIYIHIPFCISRCIYCGFFSGAGAVSEEDEHAYVRLIKQEIENATRRYAEYYDEVDSIFFGGGTPSVFKPESLIEILDAVRKEFRLSADCEITMEANPGTLSRKNLTKLRKNGFNRLSLGCQSMNENVLRTLGRIHSAEEFLESFEAARTSGFDNINVDLMFSVPGADEVVWQDSLDRIVDLSPEHISFYSLQIEEDTPLYDMYRSGLFPEVSDEMDRKMYHQAIRTLKSAGYLHYEISNAAKPGCECRHNIKYWKLYDYIGFGKSAASFVRGTRFTNSTDEGYEVGVKEEKNFIEGHLGVLPPSTDESDSLPEYALKKYSEYHINSFMDSASEFVFLGLRMASGVNYADFRERFGREFSDVFSDRMEEVKEFISCGALIEDESGIRLSENGFDISNRIMALFV